MNKEASAKRPRPDLRAPREGDLMEVTIRGLVKLDNGDILIHNEGSSQWLVLRGSPEMSSARLLAPPHPQTRPGQVWSADGHLWFCRISNPKLSYRFVPDNLTKESGLVTLDEEEFFITHDDATLVFDGPLNDGFIQVPVRAGTQASVSAGAPSLHLP